ncbi:MAG: DUF6279 family lipoprotein [Endozoicomonas sp.]
MRQDTQSRTFLFTGLINRPGLILILCLLPLLQSCSTSYAYSNLDWLVHWFVDDYVELTEEQKQDFDLYFSQLQQWHREEELDRYLTSLKAIRHSLTEEKLSGDALAAEVTRRSKESYQYWLDLIATADQPLGKLAVTLSAQQKDEFFLALDKKLAELDDKAARNDKPTKRRKRLLQAVDPWFGQLNRNQQKQLKQWSLEIAPTRLLLREYREVWSAGLKEALYAPEEEISARLSRVLTAHREWQSEAYQSTITENRRLTERLISDLLESRTHAQNRQLLKELNLWINRIERLKKA